MFDQLALLADWKSFGDSDALHPLLIADQEFAVGKRYRRPVLGAASDSHFYGIFSRSLLKSKKSSENLVRLSNHQQTWMLFYAVDQVDQLKPALYVCFLEYFIIVVLNRLNGDEELIRDVFVGFSHTKQFNNFHLTFGDSVAG